MIEIIAMSRLTGTDGLPSDNLYFTVSDGVSTRELHIKYSDWVQTQSLLLSTASQAFEENTIPITIDTEQIIKNKVWEVIGGTVDITNQQEVLIAAQKLSEYLNG